MFALFNHRKWWQLLLLGFLPSSPSPSPCLPLSYHWLLPCLSFPDPFPGVSHESWNSCTFVFLQNYVQVPTTECMIRLSSKVPDTSVMKTWNPLLTVVKNFIHNGVSEYEGKNGLCELWDLWPHRSHVQKATFTGGTWPDVICHISFWLWATNHPMFLLVLIILPRVPVSSLNFKFFKHRCKTKGEDVECVWSLAVLAKNVGTFLALKSSGVCSVLPPFSSLDFWYSDWSWDFLSLVIKGCN